MKAILEHWRQIFRFSLLACCLLFFVPQYVESSTVPVLIRDAVFLVSKVNRQERKQLRRGTIFHVGGGYYRTAAHVVENSLGEYEGKGFDEWAFFPADEFGSRATSVAAWERWRSSAWTHGGVGRTSRASTPTTRRFCARRTTLPESRRQPPLDQQSVSAYLCGGSR